MLNINAIMRHRIRVYTPLVLSAEQAYCMEATESRDEPLRACVIASKPSAIHSPVTPIIVPDCSRKPVACNTLRVRLIPKVPASTHVLHVGASKFTVKDWQVVGPRPAVGCVGGRSK